MEYQEYPKALYRRGEYQAVHDEQEEATQRKDGWSDWHTDHARSNAPVDDSTDDKPAAPTKRTYNKKVT